MKDTLKPDTTFEHVSVLAEKIKEILSLSPGAVYVDGTLGLGGHAIHFSDNLEPNGTIIGFDWDINMLNEAKVRLSHHTNLETILINQSFSNIPEIISEYKENHPEKMIKGILLDLGVNNMHFKDPTRGLSFLEDSPLDMRMDQSKELTAADIINTWNADDLSDIFQKYGDERWHKRIVAGILDVRSTCTINSTLQLSEIIIRSVPGHVRKYKIHPATRVFQALRIAVNDELNELENSIIDIAQSLSSGGKLAIISYHSGEDRIVKHTFRKLTDKNAINPLLFSLYNKKPIIPEDDEIRENPKSRSAKLRVLEKL